MKWISFVLMLLLTGVARAADPAPQPVADPGPVLQDLRRTMSSVRSVYFDFIQERHLKLFTEPLKSEGVLLIEQPDRIRWETTTPYQSILLGNQKSVAQFERTGEEWKKLKLGFPQLLKQVMEQMTWMNQGQVEELTRDFTLSLAVGTVTVLTLVPKDDAVRAMLSSLELQMRPDFSATLEVVMREPSGEFTRILFRRERRNVTFPPATFDQTKPLNVDAIKRAMGDLP